MLTLDKDLCIIVLALIILFIINRVVTRKLLPFLVKKRTKIIEKNPNWIMSEVKSKYYGFQDIDILLVESPMGILPRFRIANNRYELLLPTDVSTRDIELIAQLALMGKIKVKYGLLYEDKSTYWLSILCYMLDGGNIRQEDTKWKTVDEKSE